MSNEKIKQNTIDNRFIQTIQGKDFVLYAGLLDLAHQKGLQRLQVKVLQIPHDENNHVAICMAKLTSKNGDVYSDVGDANPSNVTKKITPHILRMASTRAKARALRDFCNIGLVCVDELDEDTIHHDDNKKSSSSNHRYNGNGNNGKENGSSPPMSEAQRRAIFNLAKRKKMSDEDLMQMVEHDFKLPFDQLTVQSASHLIQYLQNGN